MSGPVRTPKPASRKMRSMRAMARVTGCRPAAPSPRPGSVTSTLSAASFASSSACSSARRRASQRSWMVRLAPLIAWPAAGRSAGGRLPSAFRRSVSTPFLPSHATRPASSAGRSSADSMSEVAGATSSSGPCIARRSGLLLEAGLRLRRNGAERLRVVHGDVRQHLAVDVDLRLVQPVDEAAVGQPVQARRGVDARDPERAEIALALAPVAVGVLPRLDDGLLRDPEDLAAGAVVALRLVEDLLVA